MKPDAPQATKASTVYEELRADILSAVLEPGAKLRIEFVCERYRARNTPVREALNRLAAEGLLQRQEQRGFSVASMSAEDLSELTRARVAIEVMALRESLAHRDAAWEEHLVLARHRLERTPRSLHSERYEANPEWERRHREFHRALIAACGSRWLRRFSDELADHAYRYRQRSMQAAYLQRDVAAEHAAIADAALAGDSDRAVALLQAHFETTATLLPLTNRPPGEG
jgi:DNA-binding GntR family transcriptional regulator